MDRDEQRNLIADPAWEPEMRAKIAETISTLGEIGVTSEGPVNFEVQGVPVVLMWTAREARIEAGDDVFTWRFPLAWLTVPPT